MHQKFEVVAVITYWKLTSIIVANVQQQCYLPLIFMGIRIIVSTVFILVNCVIVHPYVILLWYFSLKQISGSIS